MKDGSDRVADGASAIARAAQPRKRSSGGPGVSARRVGRVTGVDRDCTIFAEKSHSGVDRLWICAPSWATVLGIHTLLISDKYSCTTYYL